MKLFILAVLCSIAALTWGESDVKDASSLTLDDVNIRGDRLFQGYQLLVGGAITSPDRRYSLIMQGDGNLVLYKTLIARAIWSSNTYDQGGVKAVLQYDGNFVVYTVNNTPRWNSRTNGRPANFLQLQNDGNLVLYGVADNVPQWSTGTWERNSLRTESFNSASVVNMGKLQDALPPILSGPVHFDTDPISVPDQASNRTLGGIN